MNKFHPIALLLLMSAICLAADAPPAAPPAPPATTPVEPPPAAPPVIQLTLVLTDGSRLIGVPVEMSTLPLKLSFTKLDIPLHLITEGQFSSNRAAFAVKFANSDSLTGALELENLKLRTTYGQATIPLARVARITITATPGKP